MQIARLERTMNPYYFHHIFWIETLEQWYTEGLPKEAHPYRVIGLGHYKTEWLLPHDRSLRTSGHLL
jgi:hypothetical protein